MREQLSPSSVLFHQRLALAQLNIFSCQVTRTERGLSSTIIVLILDKAPHSLVERMSLRLVSAVSRDGLSLVYIRRDLSQQAHLHELKSVVGVHSFEERIASRGSRQIQAIGYRHTGGVVGLTGSSNHLETILLRMAGIAILCYAVLCYAKL